jgi:phenylpyruvate tautomerase PptA (4-oxalocrotonate tautomerase family)
MELEPSPPKGDLMPLVTVTLRKGKSSEFKSAVLSSVHRALVASGVPDADRFQRVLELGPDDFRFDTAYPDVSVPRTDDFVLIEVLLSVGRSVKIKRKILSDIIGNVAAAPGLHPDNVMVVFKETQWENWAFASGRVIHA